MTIFQSKVFGMCTACFYKKYLIRLKAYAYYIRAGTYSPIRAFAKRTSTACLCMYFDMLPRVTGTSVTRIKLVVLRLY